MEIKKPIQSRVLWFNALSVIAIVITEILASTELKDVLGSYVYLLMIAGALINGILRLDTTKPLTEVKEKLNPVDEALRKEAEENGLI